MSSKFSPNPLSPALEHLWVVPGVKQMMANPGERGFLQHCSSPLVNGRSREVQSLEIISAKTLLSLQWVFLNSSNNVKSCREFPKAVTGPFLDHYVPKTGLAFCCRNRSRTFSRTSCFSGVYLSRSIEFVTNTDFSGTSWNGRDKLLAV